MVVEAYVEAVVAAEAVAEGEVEEEDLTEGRHHLDSPPQVGSLRCRERIGKPVELRLRMPR